MIHLIYSSFGGVDFYRQTVLSVYSLFLQLNNKKDDVHLILYTDNISFFQRWFKGYPITYKNLNNHNIEEYLEGMDLIHMVKIKLVELVINKYEGKVIYLDSDTFFFKNPHTTFISVDKHHSLLERKEYYFYELEKAKDKLHYQSFVLFRDRTFKLMNLDDFKISVNSLSICAGVVGIDSSNKHWLEDVRTITKQIFSQVAIFTAEQWGFSSILQSRSTVYTTQDVLLHYCTKQGKYTMGEFAKKIMRRNCFFVNKEKIYKDIQNIVKLSEYKDYEYDNRLKVRLKLRAIAFVDNCILKL